MGLALLGSDAAWAREDSPGAAFSEAVRLDLSGEQFASQAFALYKEAADQGFEEAQFNVGVMLDSGRGVTQDMPQAALWYARAAARGSKRAAFNLGQLYQSGQGVPQNRDVASAWYANSALPAAKSRAARMRGHEPKTDQLVPPKCMWPGDGAHLVSSNGVELVWTSVDQGESVVFLVELRSVKGANSSEIFSVQTGVTSVLPRLGDQQGEYMWRVLAIAPRARSYAASTWSRFVLQTQ